MGDIHALVPPPVVGLIATIAAVLCGILVGAERERREKPAGVRTLTLICLGSVMFTQASILLAGAGGDRSRIAAQVVTGVGFLGAGAIIHGQGLVIGVTTGAAIWAMAAIGVIIGSGHVAAGVAFTLVVLATLRGIRGLEEAFHGPCRLTDMVIRARPDGGKTRALIEGLVEDYSAAVTAAHLNEKGDACEITIRYCRAHRQHREVRERIAGLEAVTEIREGAV